MSTEEPAMEGTSQSAEESAVSYLLWSNHATVVADTLVSLQQDESMVDVTLRVDGESVKVHKMVLCVSSPFMQEVLSKIEDPNPCVILPGMPIEHVRTVIDFIYRGEISFVPEQLPELIKVAEALGICGLTEVSCQLPQFETSSEVAAPVEEPEAEETGSINLSLWDSSADAEVVNEEHGAAELQEAVHIQIPQPAEADPLMNTPKTAKKVKRDGLQKEKKYNDAKMDEALKDLRAGRSLLHTSTSHGVPRTTLYMKARSAGIISSGHKNTYSPELLETAVTACKEGMSLLQASIRFNIPKTVIWRRLKAHRVQFGLPSPSPPTYTPEEKQAAVEALERGEQLNAVASQYPIPMTTLFRAKARLIEKGVLPEGSIKRRMMEGKEQRLSRIEEAVAACKDGKMSLSAASQQFQVSKTSIWRRLQPAGSSKGKRSNSNVKYINVDESMEEDPLAGAEYIVDTGEFSAPQQLIILSTVSTADSSGNTSDNTGIVTTETVVIPETEVIEMEEVEEAPESEESNK